MIISIIWLVIYISLFCCIAWGGNWIIVTYQLPRPVLWIFGVLLLIILLLFIGNEVNGIGSSLVFPSRH